MRRRQVDEDAFLKMQQDYLAIKRRERENEQKTLECALGRSAPVLAYMYGMSDGGSTGGVPTADSSAVLALVQRPGVGASTAEAAEQGQRGVAGHCTRHGVGSTAHKMLQPGACGAAG